MGIKFCHVTMYLFFLIVGGGVQTHSMSIFYNLFSLRQLAGCASAGDMFKRQTLIGRGCEQEAVCDCGWTNYPIKPMLCVSTMSCTSEWPAKGCKLTMQAQINIALVSLEHRRKVTGRINQVLQMELHKNKKKIMIYKIPTREHTIEKKLSVIHTFIFVKICGQQMHKCCCMWAKKNRHFWLWRDDKRAIGTIYGQQTGACGM